jgi:hypothetical protein
MERRTKKQRSKGAKEPRAKKRGSEKERGNSRARKRSATEGEKERKEGVKERNEGVLHSFVQLGESLLRSFAPLLPRSFVPPLLQKELEQDLV